MCVDGVQAWLHVQFVDISLYALQDGADMRNTLQDLQIIPTPEYIKCSWQHMVDRCLNCFVIITPVIDTVLHNTL